MAEKDISKLESIASEVENLISVVKKEISYFAVVSASELLKNENASLEQEILKSKEELINLQNKNGVTQVNISGGNITETPKVDKKHDKKSNTSNNATSVPKPQTEDQPQVEEDFSKHIGRLDLRMGRIQDIVDHPNADTLYVEKVDVGEEEPRIIISGVRKHITKADMLLRPVVVLCNLKPVQLRGITSSGMLLCAVNNKTVELLWPPPNSVPGQKLSVEGYDNVPDKELDPKEKVFDTVAKDLWVNNDKILMYKNQSAVVIEDKGCVVTKKIYNCGVA